MPTTTTLSDLPFELVENIAAFLRPETKLHERSHPPRDLLSLAQTCRSLARVCRPIVHAHVYVACPPCPYADASDPPPPLTTPVPANRPFIRHLALHALHGSPPMHRRVLNDLICTTAPGLVSLAATNLPDLSPEALRSIVSSPSLETLWLEHCALEQGSRSEDVLAGLGTAVSGIRNYTGLFVSTQITASVVPRCSRLEHLILRDRSLSLRPWWSSCVWKNLATLALDATAPDGADEIMHVISDLQARYRSFTRSPVESAADFLFLFYFCSEPRRRKSCF
jgi:hypothetical protein